MPHPDRCIRLRRPVTLAVTEGVFVPEIAPDVHRAVEERWAALCAANAAYFDGRVWHVLGVHRNGCGGATLHVVDCAYRYHAVQDDRFDVGCRPLGAKGITVHGGRVLMGRRAAAVGSYRGLWEFAPGGAVEPGRDPAAVVSSELAEETSLRARREPTALAVLFDGHLRCWELVYRIEPDGDAAVARPEEYDELRWCAPGDLPRPLAPVARRMAGLV
jgi:8-oxo-dGTP pyrophosphatase MutT (NUDIX family)